MDFPKTTRGLSNQITRIRAYLSSEKRTYGFIDDGGGDRYYLFYLYFLLGDNRRSSAYFSWFEKQFPDDYGEPFQHLVWAVMLHRMGKNGDRQLGRAMFSNLYVLPQILGEAYERLPIWHSSNWDVPEYIDYFPQRIREALTAEDIEWIRERYHSEKFQQARQRYIDICMELSSIHPGEKRSALVTEEFRLIREFT